MHSRRHGYFKKNKNKQKATSLSRTAATFFSFYTRNHHQFLTHVNASFQYLMLLYGVLTIEHGNGKHISWCCFSGSASICWTELCTPVQKEPTCANKERSKYRQIQQQQANSLPFSTNVFKHDDVKAFHMLHRELFHYVEGIKIFFFLVHLDMFEMIYIVLVLWRWTHLAA